MSAVVGFVVPAGLPPAALALVLTATLAAQAWLICVVVRGPVTRPEDADGSTVGDPRVRVVRWSLYSLAAGAFLSHLVPLPYSVVLLLATLLQGWVMMRSPDVLRRTGRFHRTLMLSTGLIGAGATCLRALDIAFVLPGTAGAMALVLIKLLQFLGSSGWRPSSRPRCARGDGPPSR